MLYDRDDAATGPPSSWVVAYLARLREEPEEREVQQQTKVHLQRVQADRASASLCRSESVFPGSSAVMDKPLPYLEGSLLNEDVVLRAYSGEKFQTSSWPLRTNTAPQRYSHSWHSGQSKVVRSTAHLFQGSHSPTSFLSRSDDVGQRCSGSLRCTRSQVHGSTLECGIMSSGDSRFVCGRRESWPCCWASSCRQYLPMRRWRLPGQADAHDSHEEEASAETGWRRNCASVPELSDKVAAVVLDQVLKLTEEARSRSPNRVVASLGATPKDKPGAVITARGLFYGTHGISVHRRTCLGPRACTHCG